MTGYLGELKSNFLATGVGSLPYREASDAVNIVFDTLSSHIPFWPQLPQRSFYENMYVQFLEKFPGVRINERDKTVSINTENKSYADILEECFNKCQSGDAEYFSISRAYAEGLYLFSQRLRGLKWQGWAKAQIIGPFSLGLSLLDENKKPILYNAELAELLPLFLSLKAAWLIRHIKVHARTKIIIFIDEPYLVAVGMSQSTLPRQEIIDKINMLVHSIHVYGAVAGLHCCGNTDWDLVMSTDIDILNFDAYGYFDKLLLYEKALASFLRRGGMLAIGIVPTNEDLGQPGLLDRLFAVLKKHDRFLKNGCLITPSCGCSGLSQDLALQALKLCVNLAERLKEGF